MKTIIVLIHGARLDALGCYGSTWCRTPKLDELASGAVVFDHCYSSLLRPLAGISDLCRPVLDRPVRTMVFCDERVNRKRLHYLGSWQTKQTIYKADLPTMEQPSLIDATFQRAIEWLEVFGKEQDNWNLQIELAGLVPPWCPEESLEQEAEAVETSGESEEADAAPDWKATGFPDLREGGEPESDEVPSQRHGWKKAYSHVMSYTDDVIGQFTSLLKELNLWDEVTLVVTSLQGLPLGERGPMNGRYKGVHEERSHLPLIIKPTKWKQPGKRVHHLCADDYVWSTLEELHQVHDEELSTIPTLAGYLDGSKRAGQDYLFSQAEIYGETEYALRTHQWLFILPDKHGQRKRQLYVKPDDRWEMNDVSSQYPDVADHLELTIFRNRVLKPGQERPELRHEVLRVE